MDAFACAPLSDRTTLTRTLPETTLTTSTARHAPITADADARPLLEAAFRELHGARLHGFALLVSLGDRGAAGAAASGAMAEGTRRLADLRHPERAAAWLRGRALRTLARRRPRGDEAERRAVLARLGAAEEVVVGLSAMPVAERAAFVAASIERFEILDVEQILGRDRAATRRMLTAARRRYMAAAGGALRGSGSASPADAVRRGGLAARIERLASETIGGPWRQR